MAELQFMALRSDSACQFTVAALRLWHGLPDGGHALVLHSCSTCCRGHGLGSLVRAEDALIQFFDHIEGSEIA